MLIRIVRDLAITFVLCLGERLLERFLFPGLHRTAERMAAADPTRADDLATLVAEAIGLLAVIWLFNGTLYAIGWLTRRPLRPQIPPLVAIIILTLTFAGAYAQWSTMPAPPPAPQSASPQVGSPQAGSPERAR
jgi:protein-S-isoprenylcysteine O-methyltransferase Ste14